MHNNIETETNLNFIKNTTQNGKKPIHFIGLGGIGMSGLAKFLLELGYKVTGSDIKDGQNMLSITELGGTVYIGHTERNVEDASLIIVSTAIKKDNPEIKRAKEKNIPMMHRSQLLEALMDGLGLAEGKKQIGIGVSGTHGKTTTSGMISCIFEYAELNPSIVVGGKLPVLKTNSKFGSGDHFISELDESDGSIAIYSPEITVITNLEADHLDHYKDGLTPILETFEGYISRLPQSGKLIINADCEGNQQLLKSIEHQGVILYSCDQQNKLYKSAKYRAEDIVMNGFESTARIYQNAEFIGELKLKVPGVHNLSNALASIAVAMENGVAFKEAAEYLYKFTGMKRRFQVLGTVNDVQIVDDYAHHPTEVVATLRSAKNIVKAGSARRVVAVFQPHRYTRLKGLWADFVKSFKHADLVYITDVYSAGESSIEGFTAEIFVSKIDHKNAVYAPGSLEEISQKVSKDLKPGDIVLTMGAGTITNLGTLLIEKI